MAVSIANLFVEIESRLGGVFKALDEVGDRLDQLEGRNVSIAVEVDPKSSGNLGRIADALEAVVSKVEKAEAAITNFLDGLDGKFGNLNTTFTKTTDKLQDDAKRISVGVGGRIRGVLDIILDLASPRVLGQLLGLTTAFTLLASNSFDLQATLRSLFRTGQAGFSDLGAAAGGFFRTFDIPGLVGLLRTTAGVVGTIVPRLFASATVVGLLLSGVRALTGTLTRFLQKSPQSALFQAGQFLQVLTAGLFRLDFRMQRSIAKFQQLASGATLLGAVMGTLSFGLTGVAGTAPILVASFGLLTATMRRLGVAASRFFLRFRASLGDGRAQTQLLLLGLRQLSPIFLGLAKLAAPIGRALARFARGNVDKKLKAIGGFFKEILAVGQRLEAVLRDLVALMSGKLPKVAAELGRISSSKPGKGPGAGGGRDPTGGIVPEPRETTRRVSLFFGLLRRRFSREGEKSRTFFGRVLQLAIIGGLVKEGVITKSIPALFSSIFGGGVAAAEKAAGDSAAGYLTAFVTALAKSVAGLRGGAISAMATVGEFLLDGINLLTNLLAPAVSTVLQGVFIGALVTGGARLFARPLATFLSKHVGAGIREGLRGVPDVLRGGMTFAVEEARAAFRALARDAPAFGRGIVADLKAAGRSARDFAGALREPGRRLLELVGIPRLFGRVEKAVDGTRRQLVSMGQAGEQASSRLGAALRAIGTRAQNAGRALTLALGISRPVAAAGSFVRSLRDEFSRLGERVRVARADAVDFATVVGSDMRAALRVFVAGAAVRFPGLVRLAGMFARVRGEARLLATVTREAVQETADAVARSRVAQAASRAVTAVAGQLRALRDRVVGGASDAARDAGAAIGRLLPVGFRRAADLAGTLMERVLTRRTASAIGVTARSVLLVGRGALRGAFATLFAGLGRVRFAARLARGMREDFERGFLTPILRRSLRLFGAAIPGIIVDSTRVFGRALSGLSRFAFRLVKGTAEQRDLPFPFSLLAPNSRRRVVAPLRTLFAEFRRAFTGFRSATVAAGRRAISREVPLAQVGKSEQEGLVNRQRALVKEIDELANGIGKLEGGASTLVPVLDKARQIQERINRLNQAASRARGLAPELARASGLFSREVGARQEVVRALQREAVTIIAQLRQVEFQHRGIAQVQRPKLFRRLAEVERELTTAQGALTKQVETGRRRLGEVVREFTELSDDVPGLAKALEAFEKSAGIVDEAVNDDRVALEQFGDVLRATNAAFERLRNRAREEGSRTAISSEGAETVQSRFLGATAKGGEALEFLSGILRRAGTSMDRAVAEVGKFRTGVADVAQSFGITDDVTSRIPKTIQELQAELDGLRQRTREVANRNTPLGAALRTATKSLDGLADFRQVTSQVARRMEGMRRRMEEAQRELADLQKTEGDLTHVTDQQVDEAARTTDLMRLMGDGNEELAQLFAKFRPAVAGASTAFSNAQGAVQRAKGAVEKVAEESGKLAEDVRRYARSTRRLSQAQDKRTKQFGRVGEGGSDITPERARQLLRTLAGTTLQIGAARAGGGRGFGAAGEAAALRFLENFRKGVLRVSKEERTEFTRLRGTAGADALQAAIQALSAGQGTFEAVVAALENLGVESDVAFERIAAGAAEILGPLTKNQTVARALVKQFGEFAAVAAQLLTVLAAFGKAQKSGTRSRPGSIFESLFAPEGDLAGRLQKQGRTVQEFRKAFVGLVVEAVRGGNFQDAGKRIVERLAKDFGLAATSFAKSGKKKGLERGIDTLLAPFFAVAQGRLGPLETNLANVVAVVSKSFDQVPQELAQRLAAGKDVVTEGAEEMVDGMRGMLEHSSPPEFGPLRDAESSFRLVGSTLANEMLKGVAGLRQGALRFLQEGLRGFGEFMEQLLLAPVRTVASTAAGILVGAGRKLTSTIDGIVGKLDRIPFLNVITFIPGIVAQVLGRVVGGVLVFGGRLVTAAAGVVTGVVSAVRRGAEQVIRFVVEVADEIRTVALDARRAAADVGEFDVLGRAFARLGVESSEASQAVVVLRQNLIQARREGVGPLSAAFELAGINVNRFEQLSLPDVFLRIAAAVQQAQEGTEEYGQLLELVGGSLTNLRTILSDVGLLRRALEEASEGRIFDEGDVDIAFRVAGIVRRINELLQDVRVVAFQALEPLVRVVEPLLRGGASRAFLIVLASVRATVDLAVRAILALVNFVRRRLDVRGGLDQLKSEGRAVLAFARDAALGLVGEVGAFLLRTGTRVFKELVPIGLENVKVLSRNSVPILLASIASAIGSAASIGDRLGLFLVELFQGGADATTTAIRRDLEVASREATNRIFGALDIQFDFSGVEAALDRAVASGEGAVERFSEQAPELAALLRQVGDDAASLLTSIGTSVDDLAKSVDARRRALLAAATAVGEFARRTRFAVTASIEFARRQLEIAEAFGQTTDSLVITGQAARTNRQELTGQLEAVTKLNNTFRATVGSLKTILASGFSSELFADLARRAKEVGRDVTEEEIESVRRAAAERADRALEAFAPLEEQLTEIIDRALSGDPASAATAVEQFQTAFARAVRGIKADVGAPIAQRLLGLDLELGPFLQGLLSTFRRVRQEVESVAEVSNRVQQFTEGWALALQDAGTSALLVDARARSFLKQVGNAFDKLAQLEDEARDQDADALRRLEIQRSVVREIARQLNLEEATREAVEERVQALRDAARATNAAVAALERFRVVRGLLDEGVGLAGQLADAFDLSALHLEDARLVARGVEARLRQIAANATNPGGMIDSFRRWLNISEDVKDVVGEIGSRLEDAARRAIQLEELRRVADGFARVDQVLQQAADSSPFETFRNQMLLARQEAGRLAVQLELAQAEARNFFELLAQNAPARLVEVAERLQRSGAVRFRVPLLAENAKEIAEEIGVTMREAVERQLANVRIRPLVETVRRAVSEPLVGGIAQTLRALADGTILEAARTAREEARAVGREFSTVLFAIAELGKSIFSQALDSFVSQLQERLNDALTSALVDALTSSAVKGGVKQVSEGLRRSIGLAASGIISVLGLVLSRLSASLSVTRDQIESAVESTEAIRGVVAGETSVAIKEVREGLAEAMRGTEDRLDTIIAIMLRTQQGGSLSPATSPLANLALVQL